MSLAASLAQLTQQAATAFYRHAANPRVLGPADEHQRLWTLHYEARCADAEQNPAYATTLLPRSGDTDPLPATGPGLPVLPVGVRVVVDEAPGQVKVTLNVAGGATFTVTDPTGQPVAATVTTNPTQVVVRFPAPVDGLYQVRARVGFANLATVYVPVQRAQWRAFREQVRALSDQFVGRRPPLTPEARARLACLIVCDAAAHTGDLQLFADTAADCAAVPVAPSPVALYPHG